MGVLPDIDFYLFTNEGVDVFIRSIIRLYCCYRVTMCYGRKIVEINGIEFSILSIMFCFDFAVSHQKY